MRQFKEHTLKISVQSIQWFMKNCGQKIWVQSDAQLDTLRKIPGKFQLNPSCRLGGVVVTRLFHFEESQTYLRTDVKNFCQMHN